MTDFEEQWSNFECDLPCKRYLECDTCKVIAELWWNKAKEDERKDDGKATMPQL